MKTTNGPRGLVLISLALSIFSAPPSRSALIPTILHQFPAKNAANVEGANPMDLLSSGNKLFGLTFAGGELQNGVIFSLDLDGSNYQVVHAFDGADGLRPDLNKPMLLADDTLFGMNDSGFIYGLNVNGSNYHHIHDFVDFDGGYQSICSLSLSTNTLFGIGTLSGLNGNGTVLASQPTTIATRSYIPSAATTILSLSPIQTELGQVWA